MTHTAFAIGAHPDDIEFMMAGTLILLKSAGYEIHYMNVADGCCGTAVYSRQQIVRIRRKEAQSASMLIGATYHHSLVPDLDVFYDKKTLAKLAAVVREVSPEILLVPSPQDYMEDHSNTARLAVSAAFTRGMRNFPTSPKRPPITTPCAVYHALPYGLRDGLSQRIWAGQYVDVSSVIEQKQKMLLCHASQSDWLDKSQGLGSYAKTMVDMCGEVGKMSGKFSQAEGWRRHNPLGFGAEDFDPLSAALGKKVVVDAEYQMDAKRRNGSGV
ncbi:MAG TPA: PIG-L family deacetylase [Planctomycetota bacterium]|jgi:LmbE family N-acetylglucosaminyl deacetylase